VRALRPDRAFEYPTETDAKADTICESGKTNVFGTSDARSNPQEIQVNHQISWVADLKSPSEPCKRQHEGVLVIVNADDVERATAEMGKGLHDVIFNTVLISPMDGNSHYVLGSIA
jgi:hypothetical protein